MAQLFLALLGLAIGAVINVLADDLPHRTEFRQPRCPACDQRYTPAQWVAVVAFLSRRGRCGFCDASLALRRIVVEIVSALMLVFLYDKFGPTIKFLLLAVLLEGLWLITIIDLEHRMILYITVFPLAGVALLYGLFANELEFQAALSKSVLGGLAGFGIFYILYLLSFVFEAWARRMRGEPLQEAAFGGGDVNLAGLVGLAVGWPGIILSLIVAVMAGGVVAGLYWIIKRMLGRYSAFTPIPYGPFIVVGAALLLVFSSEIKRLNGVGP